MKTKMIGALCLIIALFVPTHEQSAATLISPCPDVFQYEPSATTFKDRWYGVVVLSSESMLYGIRLDIILDSKALTLGNWVGDVTTTDNIDFQVENTKLNINPDKTIQIRFFVSYDVSVKVPYLQALRLNGREICNLDKSSDSGDKYEECGKVLRNNTIVANPLVVYGEPTLEGQFPWQVALYQNHLSDSRYKCGGTLVSHKHVLTAAHCVTYKNSKPINKNTLQIHLGKHNLRNNTEGTDIVFVAEIIVHPDYNKTPLARDLSILTMNKRVEYTEFVRAACLWPENLISLHNVIGKVGSVVGWGYNEKGVVSEELKLVKMPIVDQETCLRSYGQFFIRFTDKDYTYCAGYRKSSTVCNGDSGGGMVFKMDGTWYLRGLVSLSVLSDSYECDTSHYTIFTDLAKFIPWIEQYIEK